MNSWIGLVSDPKIQVCDISGLKFIGLVNARADILLKKYGNVVHDKFHGCTIF